MSGGNRAQDVHKLGTSGTVPREDSASTSANRNPPAVDKTALEPIFGLAIEFFMIRKAYRAIATISLPDHEPASGRAAGVQP